MAETNSSDGSKRIRAGRAFLEKLMTDPDARAEWERQRPQIEAEAKEVAETIRAGMDYARKHLESLKIKWPESLEVEDWEHLALTINMPLDKVESGNFTYRDVYKHALAFIAREEIRERRKESAKDVFVADPSEGSQVPKAKPSASALKLDDRAVALFTRLCKEGEKITVTDLAKKLGTSRTLLYDRDTCPTFRTLWDSYKSKPHKESRGKGKNRPYRDS